MKYNRKISFFLTCFLTSLFSVPPCLSQNNINTVISGVVADALTKEPLPAVSVILENTTVGTVTDNLGRYRIVTSATSYKIKFSFLGYEPVEEVISPGKNNVINAELTPKSFELNEITVKPGKITYRNKDNPAVEMIRKVIENKGINRKENLDYYSYSKYEKIVFSLSNIDQRFRSLNGFRKYQFIFDNIDTSRKDGKTTLPLYIKETFSDYYYRKNPRAVKEIIKADKTIDFEEYIDNRGFNANLEYMFQNINIYDNEIFFLTNKFLSPVATEAPLFYRFYIMDTTQVDNIECYKMFFEPRNPADFLFHGFLFITTDSSYAIRMIDMSFNKSINIDWVKDVRLIQEFDKSDRETWLLTRDEASVEFGLDQNLPGIMGTRVVSYNNYSINEPIADSIFKGMTFEKSPDAAGKDQNYWNEVRIPPLSRQERNLYYNVDSIKKIPAFRRQMDLVMVLTTEFLNLGKFEIGPIGNFYSFNPVEGSRIRFGGRTTPEFNKSLYFEGFAAYGFRDREPKYNFTATYALNHKSIYNFPVKSIRLNYQYDTRIPGQKLDFFTGDNIFLSLKRGVNDKLFYNRTFSVEYMNEFENHFSFILGYKFTRQNPGGNLRFTTNENILQGPDIPALDISEAYIDLRYAPREEFYQGKLYRDPVPSKFPVLEFNYAWSPSGFHNDYNYHRFRFDLSRRMYFSIVGYTDILFEAGKIIGKVPYPLLFIHNANQTYSYQKNAYNMMNFMEFVSDQYISLNIDHSFNGFFFNKIPLLKKLKLREVATLKVLYGSVSNTNDPANDPSLFKFPVDDNGVPLTYTLEKKPYVEASVGFSNILRILRIDVVKRLTYLNNPDVSSIGIRAKIRLDI